jgi:SAM-dependent methyltransferase
MNAPPSLAVGRRAFGADPANYDRARPPYPERIYAILRDRCGLRAGATAFEIGAGTGHATRHLLRSGAARVVAIEPDERLAGFLAGSLAADMHRIDLRTTAFEDVALADGEFDLGISATAFHWLEQSSALRRIGDALRPGAWWAMWWNVFGDPFGHDAFHEATCGLLEPLDQGPSRGTHGRPPFALDKEARMTDLATVGAFDNLDSEIVRWTLTLETWQVKNLYATFSPITRLGHAARQTILEQIGRIADEQFAGRVERPMLTPIYVAQRR